MTHNGICLIVGRRRDMDLLSVYEEAAREQARRSAARGEEWHKSI